MGNPNYSKPPIVERILGVYREIPQDKFDELLPSWVEKIHDAFPVSEPISEWQIGIENKGGVPFIKTPQPKAKLIQLFWEKHPQGKRVRGMRLRPDRLVFHLRRDEEKAHSFWDIYPEMEKWLPLWANHFGHDSFDGITLEYTNLLNINTAPQFATPDGGIAIGKALEMFAKIPGKYQSITSPYDCKVRLIIDDKMPCYFDLHVRPVEGPVFGVRIDFMVTTRNKGKHADVARALAEIKDAHELMLQQFDCFFTEEARKSFE